MAKAVICEQCGRDICALVQLGTLARLSSFKVVCHSCLPEWDKEQIRKKRVAEKQKNAKKTQMPTKQDFSTIA